MNKVTSSKNNKILVTGGAGFIGSHLVDALIKEGHRVIVIDNLSNSSRDNLNKKAKFYKIDIRSSEIKGIFLKESPEVIFHLAAQINVRDSVKRPVEDADINILGSLNLLQNFVFYSKKPPQKLKFIFFSSGGAVYGDTKVIPTPENYPPRPLSPYGCAKLVIEKYLDYYYQVFKLPYIVLRLANIYGPRQNPKGEAGVISIFCDRIVHNKEVVIYGDGKQTRDFVYVEDVIRAALLSLKFPKIGIYNIGTGKETSINALFYKIQNLAGTKAKVIYKPEREGEQRRSCLDCSLAKKELKWEPLYDLDAGLKNTIEWFKNYK